MVDDHVLSRVLNEGSSLHLYYRFVLRFSIMEMLDTLLTNVCRVSASVGILIAHINVVCKMTSRSNYYKKFKTTYLISYNTI